MRLIQSNPAISNSVNSKSLLFRTTIEFPWIYPYVFSHLLSAISNPAGLFRIPHYFELIVLPLHLNQPRYFELVKNRETEPGRGRTHIRNRRGCSSSRSGLGV